MATDIPSATPLPSPPASPTQTSTSKDLRGYDHYDGHDDETAKALAYKAHIEATAKNVRDRMLGLVGDPKAFTEVWRQTAALMESTPPYVESDI